MRELIAMADVILEKGHTSDNTTDTLTKTMSEFKHCLDTLNVPRC